MADTQKIAVPCAEGQLALHFGHCQQFVLISVSDGEITGTESLTPPPHAPGVLPAWLAEQGATVIIAGGMGQRAQNLFAQSGIQVLVGAAGGTPEELVGQYLAGALATGENICDH